MKYIAILTGGESNERDVSLRSAQAVGDVLSERGYQVTQYLLPEEMNSFLDESHGYDFVWVMIHGKGGEDGEITTILDTLGLTYQCTGPRVQALTIDKWNTKQVWRSYSLPVADDTILSEEMNREEVAMILSEYDYRCVCKARDEGSSQAMIMVTSSDDVASVYALLQNVGTLLCEEYVEGSECTVSILDGEVLPIVEIIPPAGEEFDYNNKYNGQTTEICPARYDERLAGSIQSLALEAYQTVGCTRYARVDVIVGESGPVLLEINTIPGFTSQSLFPLAAKVSGMSFGDLCERLMV